jgi:hypothetical protein
MSGRVCLRGKCERSNYVSGRPKTSGKPVDKASQGLPECRPDGRTGFYRKSGKADSSCFAATKNRLKSSANACQKLALTLQYKRQANKAEK